MGTTDKICLFCGKPPKNKNKEHVIPRWLLSHTEAMDKIGRFGFDKRTGVPRNFAYKNFTFPACSACNSQFGELEEKAKSIVINLLLQKPLSSDDLHWLLDWFDKVRIGLWLGFYYLDKNIGNIEPHLHVGNRISAHDRMLYIVKIKNIDRELSFRGCDSLSFHFTPRCCLKINSRHIAENMFDSGG